MPTAIVPGSQAPPKGVLAVAERLDAGDIHDQPECLAGTLCMYRHFASVVGYVLLNAREAVDQVAAVAAAVVCVAVDELLLHEVEILRVIDLHVTRWPLPRRKSSSCRSCTGRGRGRAPDRRRPTSAGRRGHLLMFNGTESSRESQGASTRTRPSTFRRRG